VVWAAVRNELYANTHTHTHTITKLKKEMFSWNVGTHVKYNEWGENIRWKCVN